MGNALELSPGEHLEELKKKLCRFHRAPEFNRDCTCRELELAFVAGNHAPRNDTTGALNRRPPPALKPGFRHMTTDEMVLSNALNQCSFTPGSFDKRFARDVWAQASAATPAITEKQAALLRVKVSRYRRQIRREELPLTERHLVSDEARDRVLGRIGDIIRRSAVDDAEELLTTLEGWLT